MTGDRPLGMDRLQLDPEPHTGRVRFRDDYWTWCRRHQRAEHVSEPPVIERPEHPAANAIDGGCVRVGPFMSEREANLLSGVPEASAGPLSMEVER